MLKKHSPWIKVNGRGPGDGSGRGPADGSCVWFTTWCIDEHYTIPDEATEVRFVRGKTPESLHHEPTKYESLHDLTGHRDHRLDRDWAVMSSAFTDWFGNKPGWIWVEWR